MAESRYHEHRVRASEAGERIDTLLGEMDFMASRSAAARLISDGFVRVNSDVVNKRHIVHAGDRIVVEVPPSDRGDLEAEDIPLEALQLQPGEALSLSCHAFQGRRENGRWPTEGSAGFCYRGCALDENNWSV